MAKKAKRKGKQLTRCPYCGAPMEIRKGSEIYNNPKCTERLLVCSRYPKCDTYTRLQEGTNIPLGIPADGELRKLRSQAHKSFDSVWKQGYMSRTDAYRWMADYLGLRMQDAHIGRFGVYQCKKIIEKCETLRQVRSLQK